MSMPLTRYSVGNQAARIAESFSSRNAIPIAVEGVGDLGIAWGDLLGTSIDQGFSFLQSRYGTPAGTLVQSAEGDILYRQPSGSTVTLPISTSNVALRAPEGFSTGIATGTIVMAGVGLLVVVLMMRKK